MTDELQEPVQEPKVEYSVIEPNTALPTPKKSSKNLWIISGIIIAVICLCSILCLVLVGTSAGKVMVEKAPVEAVLDSLMRAMEAKDIESAYALFSPRSQKQTPITDLEKITQGNNYVIFEGYESLTIQNLNIAASANTNSDLPQGTIANVTGTVSYEGGFTGKLTAVLEKVDGEWKLFNFFVTVSPDKLQP